MWEAGASWRYFISTTALGLASCVQGNCVRTKLSLVRLGEELDEKAADTGKESGMVGTVPQVPTPSETPCSSVNQLNIMHLLTVLKKWIFIILFELEGNASFSPFVKYNPNCIFFLHGSL